MTEPPYKPLPPPPPPLGYAPPPPLGYAPPPPLGYKPIPPGLPEEARDIGDIIEFAKMLDDDAPCDISEMLDDDAPCDISGMLDDALWSITSTGSSLSLFKPCVRDAISILLILLFELFGKRLFSSINIPEMIFCKFLSS